MSSLTLSLDGHVFFYIDMCIRRERAEDEGRVEGMKDFALPWKQVGGRPLGKVQSTVSVAVTVWVRAEVEVWKRVIRFAFRVRVGVRCKDWLAYTLGLSCVTITVDLSSTIEHYPVSVRLSEGSPVTGKALSVRLEFA